MQQFWGPGRRPISGDFVCCRVRTGKRWRATGSFVSVPKTLITISGYENNFFSIPASRGTVRFAVANTPFIISSPYKTDRISGTDTETPCTTGTAIFETWSNLSLEFRCQSPKYSPDSHIPTVRWRRDR